MLRHDAGSSAQNDPGQERSQDGIADSCPGGRDAVFPSELSRVAYKYNSGEIGCTVRESCQPGTDRTSAQDKTVYICGILSAIKSDPDHDCEKDDQHHYLDYHNNILPAVKFSAFMLKRFTVLNYKRYFQEIQA